MREYKISEQTTSTMQQTKLPVAGFSAVELAGGMRLDTYMPVEDAKRPKILLDPGHDIIKPGAKEQEYNEAELNYQLADNIISIDYRVNRFDLCTTRGLEEPCTWDNRRDIERDVEPDLVVSLHHNATVGHRQSGAEIYFYPGNDMTGDIARVISDSIHYMDSCIIAPQEKLHPRALWLLKQYKAPTILVEGGYMTNPFDLSVLTSEAGQFALAAAIYNGLAYYRFVYYGGFDEQ